jgi:hypothetical protein
MTTTPMQVWFAEESTGDSIERRLIIEGAPPPYDPRVVLWWRVADGARFSSPPVLDSFLVGPMLWAAMLGRDLVVHGPMSHGGLYNLGQLLELRRAFSPRRYPRSISIVPDTLLRPQRRDTGAIAVAALSGGLDSTFTAVRHVRRLAGDASWPIQRLVMIHGFDAPLDRPDQFDRMRRRAEPLARLLDLPLHTVVTNSKGDGRTWPHSAIPLTGAALAQFSSECGVGLVSAGAPYGTPRFGISHPAVIDTLSSNDYFRIVTDGSGFGRTDKFEALAPFPAAVAGVKVCWEGTDPARNCGECQKCVMTRLNLLAAGIPGETCFDTPLQLSHIAGLEMTSVEQARDWFRLCWNELAARGNRGPEMRLLTRRLRRVPPDSVAERATALWRRVRAVVFPAP